MSALNPAYVKSIVRSALAEDVGTGDITTMLTIPEQSESTGVVIAKQDGVIAGLQLAAATLHAVDEQIVVEEVVRDGARVSSGDTIATVSGRTRGILTAERVALNFLQRMSGIATMTSRFVELVSHTKARIADTRKTAPGLRLLEKYAVTVGGGVNHRLGLYDGILIKDNHISAAGGIGAAVRAAKKGAPHTLRVEIEVSSLNQLDQALQAGADAVLLDNMPPDLIKQAAELAAGTVITEASGGVTEDNVRQIAETGVDLISVGALTHSAPALDISLQITTDS